MPASRPRTLDGGPRRRPVHSPKGRQVDPGARDQVRRLLGAAERRPDLLIEHLHRIQDRFAHISVAHIAALAEEMGLAQAEVYEVATFYHHFDVVGDGETPPPPLTVRVCQGLTCELFGGRGLADSLAAALGPGLRVVDAPCVGACNRAPVAVFGRRRIDRATPETVAAAVDAGDTEPAVPDYPDLESYRADGGYDTLCAIQDGERPPGEVLAAVEAADLRGLGGAGFPAARKWRFLEHAPKPRLVAINADEGEPGTFKDRYCLETDPHRVLEGALIAAAVVEAEAVYVYLRDEYAGIRRVLEAEIAALEKAGLGRGVALHLRRGAGSYVCGEESAMLESIEGKRGLPRNRPPFPAERGLFGRPTLINNVETVFWLRDIVEGGDGWYAAEGRPHLYSVSGRVKDPGVKRAPSAITARQLIEDYAGGMLDGHAFAAYQPGGASGGILPARLADLPLDFGSLDEHGCFLGSSALVVLSDQDDIRAVVRNGLAFFADESCGQCTPCRVGCETMGVLVQASEWDAALIGELAEVMRDASICGLGQAAPNAVLGVLRYFAEEVT